MSSIIAPIDTPAGGSIPAPLAWLSAGRCRLLAALLILGVFIAHLLYLTHNCPIDLAEDEAYYWDWSRQLDLSFYSKGPVTACLIRASCAVFGDVPAAVRFPALIMGIGLMLCLWWLTRRLFGSDRLALGTLLLSTLAPMFIAAGLIITTDPPFLFAWALATCLAASALFDEKRWAWIALGAVLGLGFLTKFTMPLWLVGFLGFLLLDPSSRPLLRTRWPYLALATATPFTLPVLIWNFRHGWVTFLHVREDVGMAQGTLVLKNILDFWTDQMSVVGPGLFLLFLIAIIHATGRQFAPSRQAGHADGRAIRFLLCMSLPIFLGVLLISFRKHSAANWPASSYFAGFILTARFLSRQWHDPRRWRLLRLLFYPSIAIGLTMVLLAHNTQLLYPAIARFNQRFPDHPLSLRKVDPTYRLHGWAQIGHAIGQQLQALSPDALVFAADYQTTAELAFYVPGQPITYCAGSYFADPKHREPFSQYDLWPNRCLMPAAAARLGLLGRDALYVGPLTDEIRQAFAQVDPLPSILIRKGGLNVRQVQLWRCKSFRGLDWPGWNGRYNK